MPRSTQICAEIYKQMCAVAVALLATVTMELWQKTRMIKNESTPVMGSAL